MNGRLYDVFYKGEYFNTVHAFTERQAAGYAFHVVGPKDKSKQTPRWNDGKDWSAKIHNEDEEDNMFQKVAYPVDKDLMDEIKLYAKSKRISIRDAVNQMLHIGFNGAKSTLEGEPKEYFEKNEVSTSRNISDIPWRKGGGAKKLMMRTSNGIRLSIVKTGEGDAHAISFTMAGDIPFKPNSYLAISEVGMNTERIYFRVFDERVPYTALLSNNKGKGENLYMKTSKATEEELEVVRKRWMNGPYKLLLDKDYCLWYIDRNVKEA